MVRYNLIRKMDIADGPGVRVSIFFQGCHFHCEECFNEETWDFNGGKEFTSEVIDEIEIDYTQELFEIAYNPKYIMDFLESIDEEFVYLELDSPVNPGIISPIKDDNNYICVIMPMRI